jgi:hypothetical protein
MSRAFKYKSKAARLAAGSAGGILNLDMPPALEVIDQFTTFAASRPSLSLPANSQAQAELSYPYFGHQLT